MHCLMEAILKKTIKFLHELLSECIEDISDPCCYFDEMYSGISLFVVNSLTNAVSSTLFGNKFNKHNKKYNKLHHFFFFYGIIVFATFVINEQLNWNLITMIMNHFMY